MDSVLIMAHPGHELLCHGWLESAKPKVYCLASGGGSSKIGRKQRSIDLIEATGSSTSACFGQWSDWEVYNFMLSLDCQPLVEWIRLIQADLSQMSTEVMMIGDMLEGYSPAHDLCRHAINCIAELRSIPPQCNLSIPLNGKPSPHPLPGFPVGFCHSCDGETTRRKIEVATRFYDLKEEVEERIKHTPIHFFSNEFFYQTDRLPYRAYDSDKAPYYETYGRMRVAEGKFHQAIGFEANIKPMILKLRNALDLPPIEIPASLEC
jgi:hypothetical protein